MPKNPNNMILSEQNDKISNGSVPLKTKHRIIDKSKERLSSRVQRR